MSLLANTEIWQTGGGCTANAIQLKDNYYCLITDIQGVEALKPEHMKPSINVLVGIYSPEDDIVSICTVPYSRLEEKLSKILTLWSEAND